jgi:hypothetical protein
MHLHINNQAIITWTKPTTFAGITGYIINQIKTTPNGVTTYSQSSVSGADTIRDNYYNTFNILYF